MSALGIFDSVRIEADVTACDLCGSTSRVGRGLCLNCLLLRCLGSESESKSTLKRLLDAIEVRDADWRIGNYQILEEIGRGGMGVIYRARQRHSRRIVALKRMLSFQADSQETLARFRREAEAAASLDHPNILPIYEVSEGEDDLPFFSMKFAAGGSLVDAAPALRNEPRRSVELMAKVARAVHYAHSHGILHRDLKPGNILLDGRGEPLVSDFGLAKWLDTTSDVTRTLTIFGTPGYIAPEQAKGSAAKLTPAADVYSLGAILFESFHGAPAISGRARAGRDPASVGKTSAEIALAHSRIRSRFGNHLREMFGARTQCALSLSWGFGRRPGTLAKARADPREAKWIFQTRLQMGATKSSDCSRDCVIACVRSSRWLEFLEKPVISCCARKEHRCASLSKPQSRSG